MNNFIIMIIDDPFIYPEWIKYVVNNYFVYLD
jgi:hypothetical protein